ncbi:hypothetical protein [Halobacillus massiliensis]|uniref:hypothetical protein n=1 Tax=Halobacillus massiliensis TaxID=1926286 RepID=UPI0009E51FB1|nr:hypothetical protein [Halobacillus massiliensis]
MKVIKGITVLLVLLFLAACGGQAESSKPVEIKAAEENKDQSEKDSTKEDVEKEEETKKEEEVIEEETKDDELSEEELLALYTSKLNELKIEPQGIATGEWNIGLEDNTLVVTAPQSEENLWDIFGVYDNGEMDSLVAWAEGVYEIVDELSAETNQPWDLSVGENCVAPYPETLPSEDLMNWSGSCGYSIPVLSGTNKDNFTLLVDYKVFGDNAETEEAAVQETEEIPNVSIAGQWYHPTSPNDYYEFAEDGSFAYISDASEFNGGSYTVTESQVDLTLPDGSVVQGYVDGETLDVGGMIFSKDQPAPEPSVEQDVAEVTESIAGTIWTSSELNSSITFNEDGTMYTPDVQGYYTVNGNKIEFVVSDINATATVSGDVLTFYNHTLGETHEYIKQ